MRLIILLILGLGFIFLNTGTSYAPCISCIDTIPGVFNNMIERKTDSIAAVANRQMDSLRMVRDSLVVELKAILRERKKKVTLGDDTGWITDSFRMTDGRTQYWSWFFYLYPDGTYTFSHKKVRIK